jgi:antitoxin PrlF
MAQSFELSEIATVTSKGQVTLPKSIRQVLGIETGHKIQFDVNNNHVVLTRAIDRFDEHHEDPAIQGFLSVLEQDIKLGQNIASLPQNLEQVMREILQDTTIVPLNTILEDDILGDVDL